MLIGFRFVFLYPPELLYWIFLLASHLMIIVKGVDRKMTDTMNEQVREVFR